MNFYGLSLKIIFITLDHQVHVSKLDYILKPCFTIIYFCYLVYCFACCFRKTSSYFHLQGIFMFTESLISNGQPGKPDLQTHLCRCCTS
jgi:hypothetical protein